MRLTSEMFESFGFTAPCLLGTLLTTLSAVAKELSANKRRSRRRLPRVAPDREERARDVRLEDLDQRPDHQVVEGSGASSSGEGVQW